MDTNRLKQIEEIYHEALNVSVAERDSFLKKFCGEDINLRREVESLLAFTEVSDDLLDASPESLAAEMFVGRGPLSLINRQIGRYKIKKLLGKGGMGEVFQADDTELERLVALKVLPIEVANDAERINRFVREAKTISALNHPNIFTIYEIGKADDTHFIATEYVEGETLHSRLKREAMSLKSILDVAIQIASALAAAHRAGIVHRDIKPENIMIRPDGFVKILDFGIAKLIEKHSEPETSAVSQRMKDLTRDGVIAGTASYMSPEQAQGGDIDARSDIFSFGAVLYEMIAGKQLFEGENAIAIIDSITNKELPPLNHLTPGIPSELKRILEKTLQKDRAARYRTANDLLHDLKDIKPDSELQNDFSRAVYSDSERSLTQTSSAAINDAARSVSSASYIIGKTKNHWLAASAGLMILLFSAIGFAYFFYDNQPASASQIESIAVLPFENNDSGTEYLSDGLTESVINNLTKIPNLRVISRNSVFRYKGRRVDSMSVGKELNVRAVLTGRIIQRGDKLIVSAELTDLENNKQIWGQQYNRQATDAFALQRAVSQDISETLRSALAGAPQTIAERETIDAEAYQLYLKGRFFWNKRTAADVRKSVGYFRQAIEKEPSYALAYAALADAYILIPSYSGNSVTGDFLSLSPQEAYTKAKEAAAKALELDKTLTEPHASLATIMYEYEENFAESETEFRKAIELNPNYATAHQWYAELLLRLGRNEEAIAEIKVAQELDPLSLIINSMVGVAYMENRQYDRAIEQLQKTIEMDANFSRAHMFLAQAYERKEMFEEAISEHEKRFILDQKNSQQAAKQTSALREAFRKNGKSGYYRKQIDLYEKGEISWTLTRAASFYVQIGENDRAFALLEKANAEKQLRNIKSPIFDGIRTDTRFQDLLRRVGLPQSAVSN